MSTVTYSNPEVIEYISQNFIPAQVPHNAKPLADEYQVTSTPTLVVLDETGKEHHRSVGFQPPEEFIPSLMVGQAKTHFEHNIFDPAITLLEQVMKEYPRSAAAPEAAFHLGVAKYKATHNAASLKEAFEFLKANYPSSEWLEKAQPYSLL